VQRLRVRYAKRGRLRFTSHRDFSRAFERAVFRARVPMAYSSGFNPHPRISYAGASPTGAASEAEYLELALAQVVDPADVAARLEEALPPGLDVVEVVTVEPGSGRSLADLLTASRWTVDLPGGEAVGRAVTAFMAQDAVPVERMTKKGLRELDCREAVLALDVGEAGDAFGAGEAGEAGDHRGTVQVTMLLRHTVPAVRPDDVLTGIRAVTGLETGPAPVLTRLEQGTLDPDGVTVRDPLVPRQDEERGSSVKLDEGDQPG